LAAETLSGSIASGSRSRARADDDRKTHDGRGLLHGLHDPRERDATASDQQAGVGEHVIDEAFAEGLRRDPERARRWVVLVDGQRDQIQRVLRGARKAGVEITIVLDIVHVLEYLWRAAYRVLCRRHGRGREVGRGSPARAAPRPFGG
jgi:hypothetical protein